MRKLSSFLLYCLLLPITATADQDELLRTLQLSEFEGRVVDASGKPLAGAEIWKLEPRERSWKRVASSGQDGSFTLPNILDPNYGGLLRTCLDGYVPKDTNVRGAKEIDCLDEEGGRRGERYERIELESTKRISGRVVDPAGRPIAKARVKVYVPDCDPICFHDIPLPTSPCADGTAAVSDGTGTFTLEPLPAGSHHLWIEAEGYLPLGGREVATGTPALTLVLSPVLRVRGRVTDAEGSPVAGAGVRLSTCDRPPFTPAATGEDGQYEISCARPERQWAFVTHDAYETAAVRVAVVSGDNLVDLKLTTPKLAVRGRVVGPEGEPVPDARVTGRDGMILTTTAADGSFSVWAGRSERSGLRVESDGYAPADFLPAPGTDLEVRLERGAVINGLLLGLPDEEAKYVSIYLKTDDGSFWASPAEIRKDLDGRWNYELRGVPPGIYRLEASSANRQRIIDTRATVGADDSEVKVHVRFPAAFMVRGRVLDPPPGVRLNVLFRNGEMSRWTEARPDGSFAEILPEGRWAMDAHSIFSRVEYVAEPQDFVMNGGPVEGLELRVAPAAAIRCSIPGAEAADRFSVHVQGAAVEPKSEWVKGAECRLPALAPGSWEVTAALEPGERKVTRRITVAPEDTELDVVLDLRLGRATLSGLLTGGLLDGVAAELTSPETPELLWRSELTHGTFTFPRLREGRYHLRIVRGASGGHQGQDPLHERDLTLAADQELQIDLE